MQPGALQGAKQVSKRPLQSDRGAHTQTAVRRDTTTERAHDVWPGMSQPTTMTEPSFVGPVAWFASVVTTPPAPALFAVDAGPAAEPVALAAIALASAGEIVAVVVLALTVELAPPLEPESPELLELPELELEPEPPRARFEIASAVESMNAIVGPATSLFDARSRTLFASGWPSEVTQSVTGPLMPSGTTHWSKGSAIANGAPPTSIWQKKPVVVELIVEAAKVRLVPALTAPVFVTESVGLAVSEAVSAYAGQK